MWGTRRRRADRRGRPARTASRRASSLSDGEKVTREITRDPGAGGQRIPFRVGTVSPVRFTIESATGTSSKKQIAIAEIEFFGRSSAKSA
ncbi:hypothetical protein [Streptomyces sediminimaris]|uniref:hypothetical protein n=1 Tax=Streptomyces sediminimaris TaxID=3383721 RepID=UPI00399BF0CB